jgi:hypothetical protein
MALFSSTPAFSQMSSSDQYQFKTWKKIYMNTFKKEEAEAEEKAYGEVLKIRKLSKDKSILRY